MSANKKILVTGATGNIGGAVVQTLMAMGANIRAPGTRYANSPGVPRRRR